MTRNSTTAKQADLISAEAEQKPALSAAEIMKPAGWRREKIGNDGDVYWRKDDPSGDYFLVAAIVEGRRTTDADPTMKNWTGFRGNTDAHGCETTEELTLQQAVKRALNMERIAPPPAFTPLEALRSLVLFHDGDSDFMAANRSLIADMPFGETSFQESLWQVARDIVTSNPVHQKEPQK